MYHGAKRDTSDAYTNSTQDSPFVYAQCTAFGTDTGECQCTSQCTCTHGSSGPAHHRFTHGVHQTTNSCTRSVHPFALAPMRVHILVHMHSVCEYVSAYFGAHALGVRVCECIFWCTCTRCAKIDVFSDQQSNDDESFQTPPLLHQSPKTSLRTSSSSSSTKPIAMGSLCEASPENSIR